MRGAGRTPCTTAVASFPHPITSFPRRRESSTLRPARVYQDTAHATGKRNLKRGSLLQMLIGLFALERAIPRTPRCRPFFELAGRL